MPEYLLIGIQKTDRAELYLAITPDQKWTLQSSYAARFPSIMDAVIALNKAEKEAAKDGKPLPVTDITIERI